MRLLLDEMLPPAAARLLAASGHDAVSVRDLDLVGAPDVEVFARAVRERRIIVTENVADFGALLESRLAADQPCVPVVFVHKADFPARGALAAHLAKRLHAWAELNAEPYLGSHWL